MSVRWGTLCRVPSLVYQMVYNQDWGYNQKNQDWGFECCLERCTIHPFFKNRKNQTHFTLMEVLCSLSFICNNIEKVVYCIACINQRLPCLTNQLN